MDTSANILIAIHHKIFRDGIELIVANEGDLTVTDSVKNNEELFEHIVRNSYDLLILDLDMPGIEIPGIIQSITHKNPEIKVLALGDNEYPEKIKHVLSSGAAGYILKKRDKEEFINAINVVLRENMYLCFDTVKILTGANLNSKSKTQGANKLTEREVEVLNLICREYTNKKIGALLSISVRTVDAHRRNILQKTGVNNTAGLVKYAIKNNIYNISSTG